MAATTSRAELRQMDIFFIVAIPVLILFALLRYGAPPRQPSR